MDSKSEVEKVRYSFIDFTVYKFMLRNQQINEEESLSHVNFYLVKDQKFNDHTISNFVADIIWMDKGSQIEQFKLLRLIVDSQFERIRLYNLLSGLIYVFMFCLPLVANIELTGDP